jgi:hypothetical protein
VVRKLLKILEACIKFLWNARLKVIRFAELFSTNSLAIAIIPKIIKGFLLFVDSFSQSIDLRKYLFRPCRHPMRTGMRAKFLRFLKAEIIDSELFE